MDLTRANPRPAGVSPDLNSVITAIYRSAQDESVWREVAHRLAVLFDADAVLLCQTEGASLRVLGEGLFNLTPQHAARLPLGYPAGGSRSGAPSAHHSGNGLVRAVDDVGFAREIDELPPGARVLTVVIPEIDSTEPRPSAHLSVARSDGRLPFSPSQQDLRITISQHLTEAVRMQRRVARRQRTADFQSLAIIHLGEAWLVLDRDMSLVECNPLARSFLLRSDMMRLEGGLVRLSDPVSAGHLSQAIDAVWTGDRAQVSVSSPDDGSQVSFEFYPYYQGNHRSSDTPDSVLVLVRELDRDLMLKIEAKVEACGLSRAERRVMVHLVRSGQPPAAIAAAIGTSERTVRCQLSSIFRKTGARNQQDLIRMTLMA